MYCVDTINFLIAVPCVNQHYDQINITPFILRKAQLMHLSVDFIVQK